MTDQSSTSDETVRFHHQRPTDLRSARPWHRWAYIIESLPACLTRLAVDLRIPACGRVLDYGCAEGPYRRLVPPGADYVGADLPGNPLADVLINPDGTVPIEDASFDIVLSTQVLEHVRDPRVYLSECARVLRPGGRLLLSTHGMMVYHPDPVDYWRWTGAGLRLSVEDAGLEIERFEGIMGLAASGLQFVQDAVYWRLSRPARAAWALVFQTAIRCVDRRYSPEGRRENALVFALVARKP